MNKVSLKSQIAALEVAIGQSGRSGLREGHQELQRKHLEAALQTLRLIARNEAAIRAVLSMPEVRR